MCAESGEVPGRSVMNALNPQIPDERISADGVGDAEPLLPNNTAEARAFSRRVEIILLPPPRDWSDFVVKRPSIAQHASRSQVV